jgi:hypothetical protein
MWTEFSMIPHESIGNKEPETLIIEDVGMFHKNESGVFERNEIGESGNISHQTYHEEIDENGDVDKFIKTKIY